MIEFIDTLLKGGKLLIYMLIGYLAIYGGVTIATNWISEKTGWLE